MDNEPPESQSLIANLSLCSKSAGTRYFTFLLAAAYGVVTLGSITDEQIILNSGLQLPVIGTTVPLDSFLFVYPLVIIFLYWHFVIYFLHYINLRNRVESIVTDNPLQFPPWAFTIADLLPDGRAGYWQRFIVRTGVFFVLPVVLLACVIKAAQLQQAFMFGVVALIAIVGCALVIYTWWHYMIGKATNGLFAAIGYLWKTHRKLALTMSGILTLIFIYVLLVFADMKWNQCRYQDNLPFYPVLRVESAILTHRPADDYEQSYWTNLRNRSFRGATISGVYLKRSNLSHSDLTRSNLSYSVLDSSNLTSCCLINSIAHNARFVGAQFDSVSLSMSRFNSTSFEHASLKHADMRSCSTRSSNFRFATLCGARLDSSVFIETDFNNVDLRSGSISYCYLMGVNFKNSDLSSVDLRHSVFAHVQISESPRFCYDEKVRIPVIDVYGSVSFDSCQMPYAQLDSLDFSNATFSGTNLSGASLIGAKHLTVGQLSNAYSLYQSKLDTALLDSISVQHPDLLAMRPWITSR